MRHRLGTERIRHRLQGDVNIGVIPCFHARFHIDDKRSVGGAAPKAIVVVSANEQYIAKAPSKPNSTARECVTEYLISRLGKLLELKVARSRLAILPGSGADWDVRFMSRVFLKPGTEQLRHGIDLVAAAFDMEKERLVQEIRPGEPEERRFYTVELVEEVLAKTGRTLKEAESLRRGFARMAAFDALIGTNDRHSENWGIVENVIDAEAPRRFAPIYDTARALFWNYSDAQLEEKGGTPRDRRHFIQNYADSSRPLITSGDATDNHFRVVEKTLRTRSMLPAALRELLAKYDPGHVRRLLQSEFGRLLSRIRLELIDDLLTYRYNVLVRLLR